MGTYTLTLKDGSSINVEAPPNTPRDQLVRMAQMQMRAETPGEYQDVFARRQERAENLRRQREALGERTPIEQDEETGFIGDILSGFTAGAIGVGEQAALGAATLLDEEAELAARDRIQGIAETIRPDSGDPEDLTYKIASAFGSIAGVAAAGAAAAYGGAAAGLGATGAGIAGLLGAGTIGVGAGAGEASERAREFGATEEERTAATRRGALIGATEALPLGRVLGPIGRRLAGDLGEEAVSTMRDRIVRAARTGGEEAAQEAAANILQNLNERGYNAEQAILEGAGEAGAIGGVAGGTLQLMVDTFLGRRARGAAPAEVEEGPEALPAPEGPAGLLEPPRPELPAPGTPAVVQVGPTGEAATAEQMRVEAERRRAEEARAEEQRLADLQDTRIPFSQQRTDEEYRAAQERAREREALRAAERGDVEGFEQPDLFALEREQERRRLGEPTPREEAPLPTAETAAPQQQGDLVDLIQEIEQGEQYAAARRTVGQAREAAQEADIAARSEAEAAERIQPQVQAAQEAPFRQAAARRAEVVDSTLAASDTTSRVNTEKAVQRALADAGIKRTDLTRAERNKIRTRVAEIRETRPATESREELEVIEEAPEARQLDEMEARIPERVERREPMQLGFPGLGQKRRPSTPQQAEPAPEPQPITKEVLDQMGIAPTARIRKRVMGRDLTDPATRQQLVTFANSKAASQSAQLGISRYLEGVPEAQPDLFTPRGVRKAQPTPAPTQEAADVGRTTDTGGVGVSPTSGAPSVAERGRRTRGTGDTTRTAAPRQGGLGRSVPSLEPARVPTGGQRATLATAPYDESLMPGQEGYIPLTERPAYKARFSDEAKRARQLESQRRFKEETERKAAERKTEEGKVQRRPAMPVLEVGKQRTEALAPKPQPKKTTTRTGETKASIEAKLMDAYDANTSADHKRFVKTMAVEPTSDPMTVTDKEKVLKLLNTKSNKQVKNTTGAVQKYLGAYEDPILGLQDAIDDVVSEAPNFRKAEDMTADEIAFFGPDNKAYLPARGKNSAQATLDWAAENMSEATKRWITTAMRDAKKINANVAAFEATDLVAKRREIEALLEGGFDLNTEADAKALDDLMEKLGIDETDPMLRSMIYKGGMFNMQADQNAPLPSVVTRLLKGGNLQGALRALAATTSDPDTRAVAEKLAKVAGDTKVEIGKDIDFTGRFTRDTNTIRLSDTYYFDGVDNIPNGGMNAHTLLHEMTHAATVATLAKKNHPLTRKLQKIFDETKDHMPTAYGSTSVEEFVAEAFSNPDFQRMLAGLKVKGDPLTPFAKIKAAISNFLRTLIGKPVKPVESALEQTTGIIDNILAPAPNNEGTGEFFMLSPREAGRRAAETLDSMQKSVGPVTKEFRQKFSDQVIEFLRGKGKDKTKRAFMGFLPSQAVADVARSRGITGMYELHKMMEEQRGAVAEADKKVEGVLKSVASWAKNNEGRVDTLNKVIYTSTIEQVDPSKPRSYYEKMGDPEKLAAYDTMRKDWGKLGSDGRKVYEQMRDTYKKQYENMRDVIYGKIDETISDQEARKELKNEVYARLFETGTIEPYFPLTRSGDYWLSYTADGEFNVEAFETLAERDRAMADLKKDKTVKDVEKFVNLSDANYAKAPPSSFVGQTLQTLRANKVDDKVQAEILRLFVEALPETSFAKSLQRRKGTPGYKEDAIHALKTKAFDLGRQVERLRYSAKIRDLQDKIMEDNATKITDENKYLVDEIMKRADFARNPPKDSIAQTANRLAFIWTIGFNASSAVVNLSQIPLFVYPMLSGRYGWKETTKALRNAQKMVTSSGLNRKIPMVAPFGKEVNTNGFAMPGIDNYFELDANGDYVLRKDLELETEERQRIEEIKPLMEMMAARGQLNRSLFADSLGLDNSGRERGIMDWVSGASAFMFHNVEMFNRQVSTLTAYQLELDRLNNSVEGKAMSTAERQQAAAEQALYDTQQTNGGAVLETAPRFAQEGVGRVALMYKSYGIQMYYTMFKTARKMLDAQNVSKEERSIAAKQLAGIMGTSFLLAGAVGMPLARELMQLMDLFLLDEEEDNAETMVRKTLGETLYKGPLTALLGVDVSSRIGLSGLILQANRFNTNASLEEDFLHYFGGPAWSTVSSMNRGFKDMMDGNTVRGIESMVPGAVRNAVRGIYRYPADDGILTRRGDPITDDLSFGDLAAQVIGFAPSDYTFEQERNQVTKRIDRAVNARRTRLLRQYYVALRMGDGPTAREVMGDIREFNRRHRSAAITPETMMRSMRQHMETSATMYNGITISPNMRRVLQQQRDEWDQGFQLF